MTNNRASQHRHKTWGGQSMSEFVPNGRRAWIVAGLLFLYSVVNFID